MDLSLVRKKAMFLASMFAVLHITVCYPVNQSSDDLLGYDDMAKPAKKADVFVSRGWGAGGMPFNVLYTQHPKITRLPQMAPQIADVAEPAPAAGYISEPQALRSLRQDPVSLKYVQARRQYSVIPQLFVSYGWGPVGK